MDGLIVLHASKFHHFADGEHLAALREFKNLLQIVAIINVFRHRSSPPFQDEATDAAAWRIYLFVGLHMQRARVAALILPSMKG